MSEKPPLPSVSVVIEWENVKLSEAVLARRMLAELARQTAELAPRMPSPPEVLLMYARDAFDPAPVEAEVRAAFGPDHPVQPRLVGTEGLEYYTQKNAGAREARHGIVLFLDSDVVPEAGWLEGLLGAFANPEVSVVCGTTHVAAEGLYGKAFSLFWFFPPRDALATGLTKRDIFYANNVAFRRELFLATGFPESETLRGQCVHLAERLRREGHAIWCNEDCRVSHPPPNGLTHFARRALSAGHDVAMETRPNRPVRAAYWRLRRDLRDSARRIRAGRASVGLSRPGAVAAYGVAASYHLLSFAGELVSRRSPETVRRYAPI